MPSLSLTISADAVAWYGAIVATVAAVVSLYVAIRDRSRVVISYQEKMWVMQSPRHDENAEYFCITVRNAGRRTVTLGNVGIKLMNGKALLLSDSVDGSRNKVLSENNPRTEFLTKRDGLPAISEFYRIEVYDEAGGKHYKYFSRFPTVPGGRCRLKF